MPCQKRGVERLGDFLGEDGLAGARFAFHEKRSFQNDRRIDGDLQIIGRDIVFRAFEAHGPVLIGELAAP